MLEFIIGGLGQGKRVWAVREHGLKEADFTDAAAASSQELLEAAVICNYQLAVKRWCEAGSDPQAETQKILEEGTDRIILMDEVGNGIIPLQKTDRIWREAVGRCGCMIAARADRVIRISCGIGLALKGEL